MPTVLISVFSFKCLCEVQDDPEAGLGHKQYNWQKAWYPVHVTDMMDPIRPHKTQLLGMNIVIWNDGKTVRYSELPNPS